MKKYLDSQGNTVHSKTCIGCRALIFHPIQSDRAQCMLHRPQDWMFFGKANCTPIPRDKKCAHPSTIQKLAEENAHIVVRFSGSAPTSVSDWEEVRCETTPLTLTLGSSGTVSGTVSSDSWTYAESHPITLREYNTTYRMSDPRTGGAGNYAP